MLRIIVFVFGLLAMTLPARAQDAQAIEGVITSQLEAFNAREVEEAWSYASPMIQGLFGNPANFGMMVMQGYPMVWTNEGAEFLQLREEGGEVRQTILLRDANGGRHVLDYIMIETPQGWKINGVLLVPQPDVGV